MRTFLVRGILTWYLIGEQTVSKTVVSPEKFMKITSHGFCLINVWCQSIVAHSDRPKKSFSTNYPPYYNLLITIQLWKMKICYFLYPISYSIYAISENAHFCVSNQLLSLSLFRSLNLLILKRWFRLSHNEHGCVKITTDEIFVFQWRENGIREWGLQVVTW